MRPGGECGAGGECHGDGCLGAFVVLGVAAGGVLAALDELGVAVHELLVPVAGDGAAVTVVQGGDVAEEAGELVGTSGCGLRVVVDWSMPARRAFTGCSSDWP